MPRAPDADAPADRVPWLRFTILCGGSFHLYLHIDGAVTVEMWRTRRPQRTHEFTRQNMFAGKANARNFHLIARLRTKSAKSRSWSKCAKFLDRENSYNRKSVV